MTIADIPRRTLIGLSGRLLMAMAGWAGPRLAAATGRTWAAGCALADRSLELEERRHPR